jgi:uncharacterized protein YjiS (DUF1127 family)
MTISQSSLSLGSGPCRVSRWLTAIRFIRCWQERCQARAELARLAQVGDYLLRDIGIDPKLARTDPSATAEHFLRHRPRPIA